MKDRRHRCDREGGPIATLHLVDLGRERVGFIGDADDNPFDFASNALPHLGYSDVLAASGIPADLEFVFTGPHGRDQARTLASAMLMLERRPTAIFAASDTQAMGVMDVARLLDIRIPGDLSVVGFDDIEMSTCAGLTTVRKPLEESGRRAAEILIDAIAAPDRGAICEELPLELVVRETTGSP